MTQTPSPWLLFPCGLALGLFATANRDPVWTPACFALLVLARFHSLRLPPPASWSRLIVGVLTVSLATLALVYQALLPSGGLRAADRIVPFAPHLFASAGLCTGVALVVIWHVRERAALKTGLILSASCVLAVCSGNFFGLGLGHGVGQALFATSLVVTAAVLSGMKKKSLPKSGRERWFRVATMLVLLGVISAGSVVTLAGLRLVEVGLFGGLDLGLPAFAGGLGGGGQMRVKRDQRITLSRTLVAAIDADQEPGYLRTEVLFDYEGGRFTGTRGDMPDTQTWAGQIELQPTSRASPAFGPADGEMAVEMLVYLPGRVPIPYGTRALNTDDGVSLSERHGDLIRSAPPRELSTYGVSWSAWREPGDAVSVLPEDVQACLAVPEDVRAGLAGLTREIVGESVDDPLLAAAKLQAHLRSNHEYALEVDLADEGDPIVDFVTHERPGWCEHYAAAMALCLRSIGIPTRVVCGFVSSEYHSGIDRWIVREGDAHAWCEVLDEETGAWVAFDATPASATEGMAPGGTLSNILDNLRFRLAALMRTLRGMDPTSWIDAVRDRPWRALLPLGAVIAAAWLTVRRAGRWRRALVRVFTRSRAGRRTGPDALPVEEAERCLKRVSEPLASLGYGLHASETVEELQARLVADGLPVSDGTVTALESFFASYGELRFGTPQEDADHDAAIARLRADSEKLSLELTGAARGRDGS